MTTASQVPALVAAHQDYLRSTAYEEYAASFFTRPFGTKREPIVKTASEQEKQKVGADWCAGERDLLNIAALFHISESMAEVAKVAAQRLPSDSQWLPEILPAPVGVLVFEQPLVVIDAWGKNVTIAAVTWHSTHRDGVTFNQYTDITTPYDDYNRIMTKDGTMASLHAQTGRWSLCHAEGFTNGMRIGSWVAPDDPELEEYRLANPDADTPLEAWGLEPVFRPGAPLFGNISMVFYSIFLLMDQSIATLSEEHDRKLARRNMHKPKRPPTMVTVIRLRRQEEHGYHEEGTGRWLTYRSQTRAHWRKQPYGPGRTQYKRILIHAYWRGPKDGPIWQPSRVSTLVR